MYIIEIHEILRVKYLEKKIEKIFEKVLTLQRVFGIVPIVANEC